MVGASKKAGNSSAVVITLQPAAEKKGVTYYAIMEKAKKAVLGHLDEFGSPEGFRIRRTATGARIMEVPGADSGPVADALAERVRTSRMPECPGPFPEQISQRTPHLPYGAKRHRR
ncbi:hypothetical protein PYW08_000634 [Mythimna loreyi]|uniref:Uncharacterized protein n=1 Tax=Mythimna loreyi TaxID=667449 RepID=A0ACC2RCY7_9NEOP|nr:hypothetical protein PYW08_000634 [Mythimna loreyi]